MTSAPQTSFITSGERAPHDGSYIIINQSYVQYLPPIPPLSAQTGLPILFVHGGGMTGASWEVTPDRRPGWAPLATRPPFSRPAYILDVIDLGRSQRAPDAMRQGGVEHRTAEQVWKRFRFGPIDAFDARAAYPGGQFPVEHFDALVGGQAARRHVGYDNEARGVAEVIRELGTCQVVAHSHGGALTVEAMKNKDVSALVKRLVLVEPAPVLVSDLNVELPGPTLLVWGDYLADSDFWKEVAPLYGTLDAEVWHLPQMGVTGNSHFPMLDKNSDVVANMIFSWLDGPGAK